MLKVVPGKHVWPYAVCIWIIKHLCKHALSAVWSFLLCTVLMQESPNVFLAKGHSRYSRLVGGSHLLKERFAVTHTIRQSKIPALLESQVTKHTFCQNHVSTQTNCFSLYLRKNLTWLKVCILRTCQVFLSPVKLCIRGLRQTAVSWAMCYRLNYRVIFIVHWLDGPGIESRWGGGSRFSLPGPDAHPASYTMGLSRGYLSKAEVKERVELYL